MEIVTVAGNVLTQLHEKDLDYMVETGKSIRDLKILLATEIGFSRFRLRLLSSDMGELDDDISHLCECPAPRAKLHKVAMVQHGMKPR